MIKERKTKKRTGINGNNGKSFATLATFAKATLERSPGDNTDTSFKTVSSVNKNLLKKALVLRCPKLNIEKLSMIIIK